MSQEWTKWTVIKLKKALSERGVPVPSWAKKSTLQALYRRSLNEEKRARSTSPPPKRRRVLRGRKPASSSQTQSSLAEPGSHSQNEDTTDPTGHEAASLHKRLDSLQETIEGIQNSFAYMLDTVHALQQPRPPTTR